MSLPIPAVGAALREGLSAEPTVVIAVLRTAALAWALFLLLDGARRRQAAIGTFAVALGLGGGLGLVLGAGWTILAALLIAAAVLAGMLTVDLLVPRFTGALACSWPLAAAGAGLAVERGALYPSAAFTLTLVAVGVLVGALHPRVSLLLLAAAEGAALLAFALGLGFPVALASSVASVVWQGVRLRAARRRLDWRVVAGAAPSRPCRFLRSLAAGVAALVGITLAIALLAPMLGPGEGPWPQRLERLRAEGHLKRAGLLLLPENSVYLVGRAFPVAIVSPAPGLASRLALLLHGSSPLAAVHRLRAVKERAELERMRRAAAITSRAFADCRPLIRPGASEADVERCILDSFASNGATGLAFPPIVAAGVNALLPHYQRNNATMNAGLVVIDIGCSFDGYASDMTRTFPVGEPTAAERRLLEVVAAAQDVARAKLRAGARMADLEAAARQVLDAAGFGPYFTHSLGHHVGLSVHDPGPDLLAAGMVVTLEPGVYVPRGAPVDPSYWDLGARIEDTFVVTPTGAERITDPPAAGR